MRRLAILMFVVLFLGPVLPGWAQDRISGATQVVGPVFPTLSPRVRDLPPLAPVDGLYGLEMKRRDEQGFLGPEVLVPPVEDPLVELQRRAPIPAPSAFDTPIVNVEGADYGSYPPDCTGDVGPDHVVQGVNAANSTVWVFDKNGVFDTSFTMESLSSTAPCNNGYCDPVILYDQLADRWVISEFSGTGSYFCVYVSQTPDPTGAWYAYTFNAGYSSVPDYPKYGVWPLDEDGDGAFDDGAYLVGVNAGTTTTRDVFAMERSKMLAGQPATMQKFSLPDLAGWGFQLFLPAGHEGPDPPPSGARGLFLRPVDTEIHGGTCAGCDLMEMRELFVDWAAPANSLVTQLPSIQMADWDHTLCGTSGNWDCMPQPGTTQAIDPIREPLHFPLQYRNFGTHETLVGAFAVDVDGTDHAAVRWFELRKEGSSWYLYQEGTLGGEAGVHRSVASAAMDGSGNIAVGYTRTGSSTPYYPSLYYSGRISTDPLGTMPHYEHRIIDGVSSQTTYDRWGDYAGIGVDPVDECTFWFFSEYMESGSSATRVASFRFDECGCEEPGAPSSLQAIANGDNRIDLTWAGGSPAASSYSLYRAQGSTCSPAPLVWTLLAEGLTSTSYSDTAVSGGTSYAYHVVGVDATGRCQSAQSSCASETAEGTCTLSPTFAGLSSITAGASSPCSLDLEWGAAVAQCGGEITFNIYRSTDSGFIPGPGNLVARGVLGTSFHDAMGLASGTTYYCVVRAVDDANGAEDSNLVRRSAVPMGSVGDATWQAGAEAGDPAMTLTGTWHTSTARVHGGTGAYHSGYADSSCGALRTPPLALTAGQLSRMTYWTVYDIESRYDGGVVEVSNDGGSSWTQLTPAPAYPDTFRNTSDACGYANNLPCYTGTNLTWTQYSVTLSAYNGQTVLIRWNFSTDGSLTEEGWYVDDVVVSHVQTNTPCSTSGSITSVKPVPDGLWVSGTATRANKTSQDGSTVDLTWDVSTCASPDYNVYWGTESGLPSYSLSGSSCGMGTTGSYSWSAPAIPEGEDFVWWVLVGSDASAMESSWGRDSAGNERHPAASNQCGFTAKSTASTCP